MLITGAGGYIGSALARAVGRLNVSCLVMLDSAEYGLYRLEQHFRAVGRVESCVFKVGNVCDAALLREIFAGEPPDMVLHAAALKHVPLMEENAIAAAETNVLGTKALLGMAAEYGTRRLVFLSTDKAVEPVSVMGATKRIAEQLVLSAHVHGCTATAVRLCNVLGSTGSVAPHFARQVARGGPVTVTHPNATRYFMTCGDAVRHLLRAAVAATPAALIVPEAGEPVGIEALARYMIAQAPGPKPVDLVYTGLRAADKLHERLVAACERVLQQDVQSCACAVRSSFDVAVLRGAVAEIEAAVRSRDRARLLRAIQTTVPEYRGLHDHADAGVAA